MAKSKSSVIDQKPANGGSIQSGKTNEDASKKGTMKMSKEQNAATTETNSNAEMITKKYKYFDLSDFQLKSKEVKVSFTPAKDYAEAVSRLGNDQALLTKALNSALRDQELSKARKEVLSLGAPKKVVLDFVKPFRAVPPYSTMVTKEKGDSGWKEEYAKQTQELIKQVASNEFMLNAIRAAAEVSSDDDSDEDTE